MTDDPRPRWRRIRDGMGLWLAVALVWVLLILGWAGTPNP